MLKKTDLRYILNLAENATLGKKYRIGKKIPTYGKVVNICNTLNHDLSHKKIFYELFVKKTFLNTKFNIYITFYDGQKYKNHFDYIKERYDNKYKEDLPLKIVLEDMIQTRFQAISKVHNYGLITEDENSVHCELYTEIFRDQKVDFYRVFIY